MKNILNPRGQKLLKILLEELGEDENELKNPSVDAQIDALLIQYEKEASDDSLNEDSPDPLSLKFLLEQEEAEETEETEEETEVEIDVDDDTGEEPKDDDKKLEMNLTSFARNLARLYEMHEKLLSIEEVILKRAYRMVQKNYGDKDLQELKDILLEEFNVELSEEAEDRKEFDRSNVPPAAGAGPAGGGA